MFRSKVDYGIDLGTTNSAIARMENGEPKIITNDMQTSFIMPSCVGVNKKQKIQVGYDALRGLNSERQKALRSWKNDETSYAAEFKRTIGTNEIYHIYWAGLDFDSEQLSAEVLKKLKSFIINDDELKSVIITVPANFDITQKDATMRAAKLAGFQFCELLQEPIAASMAYGLNKQHENGYWVVFDIGGGTFDAALVKIEDGIMKIVDTDGDNRLGGKDIDMAMVDELIIPWFQEKYTIDSILEDKEKKFIFQNALKQHAEEAKIKLSFEPEYNALTDLGDLPTCDDDGEELELDVTINQKDLKKIVAPIFQRAIDITKELIARNNLTGDKLDSLILVGGPTHSPILRDMLKKQIKQPDTSVDPMTVVAMGATLHASTVDVPEDIMDTSRDKTKIQLDIGYETSTVETEALVTLKTIPEKTEGDMPEEIFAEVIKISDKGWGWASGKQKINQRGEIFEVQLIEASANQFKVELYNETGDRLETQPDSFTIIQGFSDGGGAAVLSHGIGVEIDIGKPYSVFHLIDGLQKNVSLPATGTVNGLKTKMDIRPGISEDTIRIGLYQGEYDAQGSRAIYNTFIYDVIITGDDVPAFLPENSEVDLTIYTDKSSGRIERLEAYFPYLDHTHEVGIPENPPSSVSKDKLEEELKKAHLTIDRLKNNKLIEQNEVSELEKEISYQQKRFDQGGTEDDRRQEVFSNLNKSLRKADRLENDDRIEWSALEKELRYQFERLEKANDDYGNEKTTREVEEYRNQVDEVVRLEDKATGKILVEEMRNAFIALTFVYQLIAFVQHHSRNFGGSRWKNPQKARQLLGQAQEVIQEGASKETLHPIVVEIINCLAEPENDEAGLDILRKEVN